VDDVAEIVQAFQCLLDGVRGAHPAQPIDSVFRADNEVIVANNLRLVLAEVGSQPRL
jgi:hypothetical protein